jgi:hypothetical protein
LGFSPQAPTYFETRDVGQHDVEHEQIRLAPLDLGQSGAAIMGNRDFVTGATKVERDQLGQVCLVLYD